MPGFVQSIKLLLRRTLVRLAHYAAIKKSVINLKMITRKISGAILNIFQQVMNSYAFGYGRIKQINIKLIFHF